MGRRRSRLGLALALLAGLGLALPGAAALDAPTMPAPPEDVRAENAGDAIELTWNPPSVNAEAVEEYRVYVDGDVVAVSEETDATLTDVDAGDVIWVTATSAEGESAPSVPEIVVPTGGPCVGTDPDSNPPVWVNPGCDPVGDPLGHTTVRIDAR